VLGGVGGGIAGVLVAALLVHKFGGATTVATVPSSAATSNASNIIGGHEGNAVITTKSHEPTAVPVSPDAVAHPTPPTAHRVMGGAEALPWWATGGVPPPPPVTTGMMVITPSIPAAATHYLVDLESSSVAHSSHSSHGLVAASSIAALQRLQELKDVSVVDVGPLDMPPYSADDWLEEDSGDEGLWFDDNR
jgi:hypothetical protein